MANKAQARREGDNLIMKTLSMAERGIEKPSRAAAMVVEKRRSTGVQRASETASATRSRFSSVPERKTGRQQSALLNAPLSIRCAWKPGALVID
jgi:hypothetical protein